MTFGVVDIVLILELMLTLSVTPKLINIITKIVLVIIFFQAGIVIGAIDLFRR